MLAATFNSSHPRSNPTPTFEVEPIQQGGFQLSMSTNVSQALQTRWDVNNNLAWDDAPLTNATLNWGNNVQSATLAHWTAWRSHQYFLNRFGLNGTDGQGTLARILIAPIYIDNAGWNQNQRTIALGAHNGTILSAVDIVGHEYGHGVSSQLVSGWWTTVPETAALNEGFSDIIGTAIERELYPTGGPNEVWNYQIGEDAWLLRDMANPHSITDPFTGVAYPQTYQEPGFWDFNNEGHHNSSVLSKWFHTLTTGSGPNGNNITPISFDDAMSIVYWGLDNYIYGDYGYRNTANALRNAAAAVFGECSPQQRAVIAALGAVNLPVGDCSPDCNYQAISYSPTSVNCSQGITLSAGCTGGTGNTNVWTCLGINYTFSGPNVPLNSGPNSSINITAPSTSGNYQYSLALSKPNSNCYARYVNFTVNVNCASTPTCDFSSGPRYVGTWYGLTVQIRSISGKNVLVTAIAGASNDKYYPRGDNFWGSFSLDPNAAGLQGCLNAGSTGWGGLAIPGNLSPPSGYAQGTESDGAVFFYQNGSTPPPALCDFSTPRQVGTWNGMAVQIRQFANDRRALVTAQVGSSNDKYFVRGDEFWDNFTKNGDADQYRPCLNAGTSSWYGMSLPGTISVPPGYQQGSTPDGAQFFSTNGLRLAAPGATLELENEVTLVHVRPNPAQDEVSVTFRLKEPGSVQVRLLDLQGRVQQQHSYKGVAGQNERTLRVASLMTGVYALEVSFEGQRVIHKLVKE